MVMNREYGVVGNTTSRQQQKQTNQRAGNGLNSPVSVGMVVIGLFASPQRSPSNTTTSENKSDME